MLEKRVADSCSAFGFVVATWFDCLLSGHVLGSKVKLRTVAFVAIVHIELCSVLLTSRLLSSTKGFLPP